MKKKKITGKTLANALTDDQIERLLDIILSKTDISQLIKDFLKVDPDMARTIEKIIETDQAELSKNKIVSKDRTMEFWDSLVDNWNLHVDEVGDEQGKYVEQDAHWEPPYFDPYSLAQDIDDVAQKMVDLIEEVYNRVDDEDFFLDLLDDIESNIHSYPEWMGAEDYEPCGLEKTTSICVLKWLWLSAQEQENSAKYLIDKIVEIRNSLKMVRLDSNEISVFIKNLSEEVCSEIYLIIDKDREEYNINNTRSLWHEIHHFFQQKFDTKGYLDTCQEHLKDNWTYGTPLIDKAIAKKDYKKADSLLEKTLTSYLNRSNYNKKDLDFLWNPETTLLINKTEFYHSHNNEIGNLLKLWVDVSQKLKNTVRANALDLQHTIYISLENIDVVIGKYKKIIKPDIIKSEIIKTASLLFEQWKNEIAQRIMPYSKESATWANWLIEAKADGKDKTEWFLEKLDTWLFDLENNLEQFEKQRNRLVALTVVMPDDDIIKRDFPIFYNTVLSEYSKDSELKESFKTALKEMKAESCLSSLINVWKKHLHHLVPCPSSNSNSQYERHARWMKSLFEINRKDYDILLKTWQKEHKRRINLWRDMRNKGLPV